MELANVSDPNADAGELGKGNALVTCCFHDNRMTMTCSVAIAKCSCVMATRMAGLSSHLVFPAPTAPSSSEATHPQSCKPLDPPAWRAILSMKCGASLQSSRQRKFNCSTVELFRIHVLINLLPAKACHLEHILHHKVIGPSLELADLIPKKLT